MQGRIGDINGKGYVNICDYFKIYNKIVKKLTDFICTLKLRDLSLSSSTENSVEIRFCSKIAQLSSMPTCSHN